MDKLKAFWAYAWERAAKTVAQTAVAALTVESVIDISTVNWAMIGGVALLSGIVSLLTSVINFDFNSGVALSSLRELN